MLLLLPIALLVTVLAGSRQVNSAAPLVVEPLLRLAVLTPSGVAGDEIESALRALIDGDRRLVIELLDQELTRLARVGTGYDGSINLSLETARGLGQALGVDYFILGRVFDHPRLPRADGGGRGTIELVIALFLVESRTGELRKFNRVTVEAEGVAEIRGKLSELLVPTWESFVATISVPPSVRPLPPVGDYLSRSRVFTDEDVQLFKGLRPPVFLRQVKPAYPQEAARVEVEATVELSAIFRADGQVEGIENHRWAGFGLDESAAATVSQLRFRSATLDGKAVPFRGLVRYNFRRPSPQAIRPVTTDREEIDRLKRSINDLLRIRPVP